MRAVPIHLIALFLLVFSLAFPVSFAFGVSGAFGDETSTVSPQSLPSKAAPGFSSLGTLGLLPSLRPTVDYTGSIAPEQAPTDIQQYHLTAQVPIYRHGVDTLSLFAGGSALQLGEAQFLSSGIEVPQDLWKAEVGAGYSHELSEGKLIGGRISLGSASDHPFSDFGVTTISLSAYYSWPSSERSRWMITVFFSNNNPLLNYVPIPGFVYLYETRDFIGMFGFPFSSIVWRPENPWTFTFSIFGPTIHAEIAYGNPKTLQGFAGFSWTQQSYLRENRPSYDERLFFSEKEALLGIRFPVAKELRSELSVGYAFDRSFAEGTRFGQDDDGNVDLAASWYAAGALKLAI